MATLDRFEAMSCPGTVVQTPRGPLCVRRASSDTGERHALPTAVVVHGLGGAATNWLDFMTGVRDVVDVYAPDLPGFGESPPPADGDLSLDGHAAAVVAVIEQLERSGPVHLAGNSMGGAIATRIAAERPDLVRTLTLTSPALPDLLPRRWPAQMLLMLLPGVGSRGLKWFNRISLERRVDVVMRVCLADPSRVNRERIAREVERRASDAAALHAFVASLRGLVAAYLDRSSRGLWGQAARVQAPTLLIYGLSDNLVNPRHAARAKTTFRNSRLVEIRDCGHIAQLERTDLVVTAFREFIADVDS